VGYFVKGAEPLPPKPSHKYSPAIRYLFVCLLFCVQLCFLCVLRYMVFAFVERLVCVCAGKDREVVGIGRRLCSVA